MKDKICIDGEVYIRELKTDSWDKEEFDRKFMFGRHWAQELSYILTKLSEEINIKIDSRDGKVVITLSE